MGWRSTGAAFRAGNYSGPLTSDAGGFASGFAATFNAGISKAADIIATDIAEEREQERELEQIRLRETLANQRAAATRSRAGNNTTVQQFEEAQAFSEEYGVTVAEAIRMLAASDWDSSQAGTALTNERAAGTGSVTGLVPDEPAAEETATPASGDTSSVVPSVEVPTAPAVPTVDTAATDNLEATEPAQEEDGFIQVASRGDTMTDVPIPLITGTDSDTSLIERADEVVAEVASSDVPVGSEPITYEDRVAAGETPAAAAATVVRGAERVPELFALPSLTDITTLESALAVRDVLEGRRAYLGGTDDYYRTYMPVLEQRIQSLGEGGLPDLGQLLQENRRDELVAYINGGWERFRGVVDEETLLAHVRRAEELEGSAMSMPSIPSGLEELRSMQTRVESGEFGNPTYVPREWREGLNSALAEAEFGSRYGDRLTPDYIFDDARTERELTGLLRSAEGSLRSDHPVVRDLQTALGIRSEMPDEVALPNLADVRANNFQALAAEATQRGNPSLAAEIMRVGEEMANTDPDGMQAKADAMEAASSTLARINTRIGEAQESQSNFINAADSAYNMVSILAREPQILTFFGGTVPSFLSSVDNEVQSFTQVMGELGEREGSVAEAEARVSAFESQIADNLAGGRINERAAAYAMYQAQEIRLAYMIVRSQQPTGPISNTDFQSAIQQVRTSSRGSTVEDSLRQIIERDRINVLSRQDALANDPQVIASNRILADANITDLDLTGGVLRPIQEIADVRGAGDALRWLSGETNLVPREDTPEAAVSIPQGAIDMLRADPSLQAAFDEKYGAGAAAQYLEGNQ